MNNTPQILYKYVSCDIAKIILRNNSVRATPPIEFNDPFEVLPQSIELNKCFGGKVIDKLKNKRFYDAVSKNKEISDQQHLWFLENYPERVIQMLKETFMSDDDFVVKVLKRNVEKYSEHFGLLCLSAKRDNILMWSHYADSHKGAVIGFDSKKLFQHGYFKVGYSEERCRENIIGEKDMDGLMKLFATKAKMWEYEDEYRALIKLDDCIKNSADIYLYSFDREVIKEFIFGIRVLENDKKDVLRRLGDYTDVNVMQAVLHNKLFKIELNNSVL